MFKPRSTAMLASALMMTMLVFVPDDAWGACKNAGGSSGGSRLSSQVSNQSVTVCADAIAVQPARKAVVKTVSKITSKPIAKATSKPSSKTLANSIPKSIAKPKVISKVVKKTTAKVVTKSGAKKVTAAAAQFTPSSVNGSVYPSNQLEVNQPATFSSGAVTHYRTSVIMNLVTEVRFTPITTRWNFGDGTSATGENPAHAFGSNRTFNVQLEVVYAVSYRVRGSTAWLPEPDTITVADELHVVVDSESIFATDEPPAESSGRVLLVGSTCDLRPGSFGCP